MTLLESLKSFMACFGDRVHLDSAGLEDQSVCTQQHVRDPRFCDNGRPDAKIVTHSTHGSGVFLRESVLREQCFLNVPLARHTSRNGSESRLGIAPVLKCTFPESPLPFSGEETQGSR